MASEVSLTTNEDTSATVSNLQSTLQSICSLPSRDWLPPRVSAKADMLCFRAAEGTPVEVDLVCPGSLGSVTVLAEAAEGVLTEPDGEGFERTYFPYQFTPKQDRNGQDSFVVRGRDASTGETSDMTAVKVTIVSQPDDTTATSQTLELDNGQVDNPFDP
eukprot:5390254-Pyramimonas_sp.AAC.2